ncbi:MAG: hypothetical protein ACKVU4_07040 [Phycisphaerales bacterium]
MPPPAEPVPSISHDDARPSEGGARSSIPAPLWAVLAFAFLASIGTGVVTNGIYFITRHAYGFGDAGNYLLGLVLGVTYIGGALATGPMLRRLGGDGGAGSRRVSTRAVLGITLAVLGLLCAIPIACRGAQGSWPIWLLIALYSPLTGVVWPVVESYVSGGRRGPGLRSAIGRFNWTWSGAIVVAYVAVSPALPDAAGGGASEAEPHLRGAYVIAALGVLHLVTLAFLVPWPREPGRHLAEHHEPHPASWRRMLTTFRILLPASYIVLTVLLPYLPGAFERIGAPRDGHMALAAVWLGARWVAFVMLERWHGWHGRWWPPVAGGILVLIGFGGAVLAPGAVWLGGGALAAMLAGLACFGVGMAVIYCGALYYAMEVGDAKVDAGGTHEALIGIGYTAGPALGLLAVGAEYAGVIPTGWFEGVLVAVVALVALVAAGIAAYRCWHDAGHARPPIGG